MPNLQNDGQFEVKVIAALFKENEWLIKQDPKHAGAFIITLKLETADGLHAFFDLNFNKRIITKGQSEGKTELEAAEAKLAEIGVPDGYLLNLQKAIEDGIYCKVTMRWREYEKDGEKKRILEAKYLNPLPKAVDISKINLAEKLAALGAKTETTAPAPQSFTPAKPPSRPKGQTTASQYQTQAPAKEDDVNNAFDELPPPENETGDIPF